MNYARRTTLKSVEGLRPEQLDYLHDEHSNSIGALLFHIAATDFVYQKFSFEGRELNKKEFKKWQAGLELGEFARKIIKGNDLIYYLKIMDDVRSQTYKILKTKDDEWLEKEFPLGKIHSNNYCLWFHVVEDEINHRGQINWLKKRIINK